MALMQCPDCRRMVSSRAIGCPNCGCPAVFFQEISESGESVEDDSIEEDVSEQNNEKELEDEKIEDEFLEEFMVLGKAITYPKSAELYIKSVKLHNELAAEMEKEIRSRYCNAKSMDNVLDYVIPFAIEQIDQIVCEDVKILYQEGIRIQEDDFKKKYRVDVKMYLKDMFDAYDGIVMEAKKLHEAREYERASRSKWEGGGFGLKGAIKGAVTAGALNAVTGVGRALGDAVVDSGDNNDLRKAKQVVYNNEDYREKFFWGFRACVYKADMGMAEELANEGITERIQVNYAEAAQEYAAALKYEQDITGLVYKMLEVVELCPLYLEVYKALLQVALKLGDKETDELLRFMSFWELREDFDDAFEEQERRVVINQYIEKHPETKQIDFGDYTPEIYVKLRNIKKDLMQVVGTENFPQTDLFCQNLNAFFESCLDHEYCLDSIEILQEVDENTTVEEFVEKIHEEKLELPNLLKEIWVKGDSGDMPDARLKSKWKLPEKDIIYFYQNSAVFGTAFGGKGFVITNSVFCDLESKEILPIREVANIIFDGQLISVLSNKCKIVLDLGSEKVAGRRFFYNCLKAFVECYACATDAEKHIYFVKKYVEKMQTIISGYAKRNGIEDSEQLLEDFLKRQGVIQKVSKTIFCPYCGKQILRTIKFCNFCGNKNTYGK